MNRDAIVTAYHMLRERDDVRAVRAAAAAEHATIEVTGLNKRVMLSPRERHELDYVFADAEARLTDQIRLLGVEETET